MKKHQAIEFLNEIANTRPEILQSAILINLNTTAKGDTDIIITANFCSDDLELLSKR